MVLAEVSDLALQTLQQQQQQKQSSGCITQFLQTVCVLPPHMSQHSSAQLVLPIAYAAQTALLK
jgi:hypothetical protein